MLGYYLKEYVEIRVNDKDYLIYLMFGIISVLEKSEKEPLTDKQIKDIKNDFNSLSKRLTFFRPVYLQHGFKIQEKIDRFLTIFSLSIKKYFIPNFSDHKKYFEVKNSLERLIDITENEKFDLGITLLETKVKEIRKKPSFLVKSISYLNKKWIKSTFFITLIISVIPLTYYIGKKFFNLSLTDILSTIMVIYMIVGLIVAIFISPSKPKT